MRRGVEEDPLRPLLDRGGGGAETAPARNSAIESTASFPRFQLQGGGECRDGGIFLSALFLVLLAILFSTDFVLSNVFR